MPADLPNHSITRPRLTGLALASFTLVLGLALIFSGRIPGRVAYDQKLYHEPAIRQFVEQWPSFDLWHYKSATTPGYHILQAAVAKFISPSVAAMQLVSLAFATLLMYFLGSAAGTRAPPLLALALTLPFACSMYVIQSSAWLLPDNAGWLGVLLIVILALRAIVTHATLALGGLVLLALVFVRQIHAWTAGLLWLCAWLLPQHDTTSGSATASNPLIPFRTIFANVPRSISRTLVAFSFTLPAIALLVLFHRYWHGLVPPVFQGLYSGLNPSAFVLILATFGAFAPFFAPFWLPRLTPAVRSSPVQFIVITLIVLIAACIVPTNHDYAAGRRTGLWNIADRLPTIAGHSSPFMLALVLVGTVALLALASANETRRRLVLLASILGYAAASTANHDLFQRYVDPFALMVLALLSAGAAVPTGLARRLAPAAPLALALLLLAVSLHGLRNSDRVTDPPPAALPPPPKPPSHHFWPW
jgi:hypothetical protein